MDKFGITFTLLFVVLSSIGCAGSHQIENSEILTPENISLLDMDERKISSQDALPTLPTITEKSLACVKQPPITKDQLVKKMEIDIDQRKIHFQNVADITIASLEITFETNKGCGKVMHMKMKVFFRNKLDEQLVVFIPPGASNYLGTLGLFLEIKDNADNSIHNLDIESYDAVFPTITNFVTIPAGGYHCEIFTISWLVSEDGILTDRNGNPIYVGNFIRPGSYQIRAEYSNYGVGFDDFDANPFIGNMVSEWLEFEVPELTDIE